MLSYVFTASCLKGEHRCTIALTQNICDIRLFPRGFARPIAPFLPGHAGNSSRHPLARSLSSPAFTGERGGAFEISNAGTCKVIHQCLSRSYLLLEKAHTQYGWSADVTPALSHKPSARPSSLLGSKYLQSISAV